MFLGTCFFKGVIFLKFFFLKLVKFSINKINSIKRKEKSYPVDLEHNKHTVPFATHLQSSVYFLLLIIIITFIYSVGGEGDLSLRNIFMRPTVRKYGRSNAFYPHISDLR